MADGPLMIGSSTPMKGTAEGEVGDKSSGTQRPHRERLYRLYRVYAPEKLSNIETALFAYRGREDEMIKAATAKYGPEPSDAFYQLVISSDSSPSSGPTIPPPGASLSSVDIAAVSPAAVTQGPSYSERLMWLFLTYCPDRMLLFDDVLYAYRTNPQQMIQDFVAEFGPEVDIDPRKQRLKRFYEYYCREKVPYVDQILLAYASEPEEKLFDDLSRKYGPEPSVYCTGTAQDDKEQEGKQQVGPGGGTMLTREVTEAFTRERLDAFYRHYCPQKLSLIPEIIATYTMHPRGVRQLFWSLEEKYGPEPCKLGPDGTVNHHHQGSKDGGSSDAHSKYSGEMLSDRLSMTSDAMFLLQPRGVVPSPLDGIYSNGASPNPEELPALANRLYRMVLFYDAQRLSDLYAIMPFLTAADAAQQLSVWVSAYGPEPSEDALMDIQKLLSTKAIAQDVVKLIHRPEGRAEIAMGGSTRDAVQRASSYRTNVGGADRSSSATGGGGDLERSLRLSNPGDLEGSMASLPVVRPSVLHVTVTNRRTPSRNASPLASGADHPGIEVVREAVDEEVAVEASQSTSSPLAGALTSSFTQPPRSAPRSTLPSVFPYALYMWCVYQGDDGAAAEHLLRILQRDVGYHDSEDDEEATAHRLKLLMDSLDVVKDDTDLPWRREDVLVGLAVFPPALLQGHAWVPLPLRSHNMCDVVAFVRTSWVHNTETVIALLHGALHATSTTATDMVRSTSSTSTTSMIIVDDERLLDALMVDGNGSVGAILVHCVKHVLNLPGYPTGDDDKESSTPGDGDGGNNAATTRSLGATYYLNRVMAVQLATMALRYLVSVELLERLERVHRYLGGIAAHHQTTSLLEVSGGDVQSRGMSDRVRSISECEEREFRLLREEFGAGVLHIVRKDHLLRLMHAERLVRDGIETEEDFHWSGLGLSWSRTCFLSDLPTTNPWRWDDAHDGNKDDDGKVGWAARDAMASIVNREWSVFTQPIYHPAIGSTTKIQLQLRTPKKRAPPATTTQTTTSAIKQKGAVDHNAQSPTPRRLHTSLPVVTPRSGGARALASNEHQSRTPRNETSTTTAPELTSIEMLHRSHPRVARYRAAVQAKKATTTSTMVVEPGLASPPNLHTARRSLSRSITPPTTTQQTPLRPERDPYTPLRFDHYLRESTPSKRSITPTSTTRASNKAAVSNVNLVILKCGVTKGHFSLYSDFSV